MRRKYLHLIAFSCCMAGLLPVGVSAVGNQQKQSGKKPQQSTVEKGNGANPKGAGQTTDSTSLASKWDSRGYMPKSAMALYNGDKHLKDTTIVVNETNQTGVFINGASVSIHNSYIKSNGKASSPGASAAVMITDGSLGIIGSDVSTAGSGVYGIYSLRKGKVTFDADTVITTGAKSPSIIAGPGGKIYGKQSYLNTSGESSPAVASLRSSIGGVRHSLVEVDNITAVTSAKLSPVLYSSGLMEVKNSDITAISSEVVAIESVGKMKVINSKMRTRTPGSKHSVLMFDSSTTSYSSDTAMFRMEGGELACESVSSPMFLVTNTFGKIHLEGVNINPVSGIILYAAAKQWGVPGTNGGRAIFLAHGMTLKGRFLADESSSINLELAKKTSFTGCINPQNNSTEIDVVVKGDSKWILTENSYIRKIEADLSLRDGYVKNIVGNGYYIYYDMEANPELGGNRIALQKGGWLVPKSY